MEYFRERIYNQDSPAKGNTNTGNAFDRSRNTSFSEEGLDVLVIKNYEDVKIPTMVAYDVVIIDYHIPQRAFEILNAIRASVYEDIYLKPCFLLSYEKEVRPIDRSLADGTLEQPSVLSNFKLIEQIIGRTEEIIAIDNDFKGRKTLLKLIHFLYTRDRPFTPVPTRHAHTGYSFPFLESNIRNSEYQEVFDLLEAGLERGFLKGDFVDKVHLCSKCNGGFINYREICPKCGTGKHDSQHTIHHFVCGYVGPESDYFQDHKLVCPKCSRKLRHIGVDYDKPSLIMECENGHIFQESQMQTYCYHCQDRNTLESLKAYNIEEYHLTSSGANVAISGDTKKKQQTTDIEGFVSLSIFKTLLKVELERQKVTNKTGVVSYVSLLMSPGTLKKHQDKFQEFSFEVARLFRGQLKPLEIGAMVNDDTFLVISPEEHHAQVTARFEEIGSNLLSLIRNNLEGSKKDQIVHESFVLKDGSDGESVLEQINKRITLF